MIKLMLVFLSYLFFRVSGFSQNEAIIMTTAKTINSTIHFYLAASTRSTTLQVDFGDGKKVDQVVNSSLTKISGKIGASQTIKVYGTGITILDCSNLKITTLDVTKSLVITELSCYKNQLKELDITQNKDLSILNCYSNELSKLDVTQNAGLKNLYCQSNLLTDLDLTKNSALVLLDCSSNQLTMLDLTKNPELTSLYCYSNKLTSMDVKQNSLLTDLFCASNQITELDLSQNTRLANFSCSSNLISSLEVSNNPLITSITCSLNQLSKLVVSNNSLLTLLTCSSNQLTELYVSNNPSLTTIICNSNQLKNLDVSKNTVLKTLRCYSNQLTTLDVSQNSALTQLQCQANKLTFATLPVKKSSWTTYTYAPQANIEITKDINAGSEIDLSSQYTINGNITTYTWKTQNGLSLIENTDYTMNKGKAVFLTSFPDSVYCEMTNATFPNFSGNNVLKTNYTKVSQVTTVENANNSELHLYTNNKTLYITIPFDAQVKIFDISGRLLKSELINVGNNQILMSETGIYLVKISGNWGVETRKVLVE